jgi:hypothetical protein
MFFCLCRYLRLCELSNAKDVPVVGLRKPSAVAGSASSSGSSGTTATQQGMRAMSYSPQDNALLLIWDTDAAPAYELIALPKTADPHHPAQTDTKIRGTGNAAVFVGGKRFAVLEAKAQQIVVRNVVSNEESKVCTTKQKEGC